MYEITRPLPSFVFGIKQRKGLFATRRGLLFTDLPRLVFYDESKLVLKTEIPWSDQVKVEQKGAKHFFVHTPKRTWYLEVRGLFTSRSWGFLLRYLMMIIRMWMETPGDGSRPYPRCYRVLRYEKGRETL